MILTPVEKVMIQMAHEVLMIVQNVGSQEEVSVCYFERKIYCRIKQLFLQLQEDMRERGLNGVITPAAGIAILYKNQMESVYFLCKENVKR